MIGDALRDVVIDTACRLTSLDPSGARPLRTHATAVYLLPVPGIVARVSPVEAAASLHRAVKVTSWLSARGFPTVRPASVPGQPVEVDDHVVTFWEHLPQRSGFVAAPADLGALLKRLHELPAPPVELPVYRPLEDLRDIATDSLTLSETARAWLLDECARLVDAYGTLDSHLGHGHLHGDAYPGNVLESATGPVLGDWDETATGPREIDLANTYQGVRFGRSSAELDAFAAAYGYDLRDWPGLPTLTAIRDVHTLGSFIRRADTGDELAATELRRRIDTLQRGDRSARWSVG